MLVYPVPEKHSFFLGVHSTITIDGFVKIGPSVAPAFALENYKGMENVGMSSLISSLMSYSLILGSPQRKIIWDFITKEMRKISIS
jgi:L-2-hydroxyglutarate oxidase LhgO